MVENEQFFLAFRKLYKCTGTSQSQVFELNGNYLSHTYIHMFGPYYL